MVQFLHGRTLPECLYEAHRQCVCVCVNVFRPVLNLEYSMLFIFHIIYFHFSSNFLIVQTNGIHSKHAPKLLCSS